MSMMRGLWRVKAKIWSVRRQWALRRAQAHVGSFPSAAPKKAHGLAVELIVSLTSYPPRFPYLADTVRSLLDQRVAADRTILWIAKGDLAALPAEIFALEAHGLEVRTCADLRSYKKLVPALLAFPEAAIVTADDDLYFPQRWLGSMVDEAVLHPADIIATRAHVAEIASDSRLMPYSDWEMETSTRRGSASGKMLFPTTGAGTLFPPQALHDVATDADLFLELAPTADDLWFFWMANLRGTPIRLAAKAPDILWWEGSQDAGLWHENLTNGSNDVQIRNLERHFGLIGEIANRTTQ